MEKPNFPFGLSVGLIIGFILCLFILSVSNNRIVQKGYKQGQIDALTGRIKYELRINPDSTKTWKRIHSE